MVTIGNYQYTDPKWSDKLTVYNGQTITYDEIGNPLQYRNGMSFTWKNGRELATFTKGNSSATYTYDSYGKRISKTVNGATTEYYYDEMGNLFLAGGVAIYYSPGGEAMSIKYRGIRYHLVKNLQGDVIALADTNGSIVAQYTYDAWGNPLSITDGNGNNVKNNATHIANVNPLRYRTYVYDTESGLYYLMSRYYDPETGRFISPDSQLNLGTMHGCNLYAYCENDPVNYTDPTGHSAILAVFAITAFTGFLACASPAGLARTNAALSSPSFYSIGNWLTMGTFDMVKGAIAPEKPLSLQHWVDSFGTAMLLLPVVSFADDLAWNISSAKAATIKSIGKPFITGQPVGTPQIGVDPNTLKINASIHPGKYASAKAKIQAEGMYGVIEVYSNGVIYNGNHRVLIAIEQGLAVDTVVKFYK